MTDDHPVTPFDWFANQFTSVRRDEFVAKIYPHIRPYLKPGERVLDLCCGAGSITNFLAEQGAQITGIDLAPYLVTLAQAEAREQGTGAAFIQANVLDYPLGVGIYDTALCFGNPITDFPHKRFPLFRDRVFDALKAGGFFILEYIDGLKRVAWLKETGEVVEQGHDSEIIRRFNGYDPANGAYTMDYHRLSTNEHCEVTEYVYIGPLLRLLMEVNFELVESITLDHSFIDVYRKPL